MRLWRYFETFDMNTSLCPFLETVSKEEMEEKLIKNKRTL
jgi:hypothetical protein